MLTTPLMAVMQPTRLLSVSAKGDSRAFQQSQSKNQTLPSFFVAKLKPDSQVTSKESAFCIEGYADESAVRQSEGEGAALLGQLSLACHFSVRSALLDIYLPCGAAGLVTHSQLKPSLLNPFVSYILSLHSQNTSYSKIE